MEKNERYYELAEKWLAGTITENELEEFLEWFDNVENEIEVDVPEEFASSEEVLRKRIFSAIRKKQKARIIPFNRRVVATVAAAVIVASFAIILIYLLQTPISPANPQQVAVASLTDSIMPGGDRAKLILSDGTEVMLDTVNNGTIGNGKGMTFIKLNDGQLTCAGTVNKDNNPEYNTLSTPRGGQYAITLFDGTKVWLNSASSLRFPTTFIGTERVVELVGEGYFEVAREGRPFKVKVGNMEVNVLGTHFNIMAYNDESSINTTLIEGSVQVKNPGRTALLHPGEQVQVRLNSKMELIRNADVEQAIAWKNGVFNFNGSDIETTMRQIARWYDIEVIYDGQITEHFNGTISRNVSIEKVLQMLQHTGVVEFKTQGRKIFVR